jgi:hypothetical protein
MKLEKLQDLLTIDTDSNRAQDNKNLLKRLKQLLKEDVQEEKEAENLAGELPYTGVSIVGTNYITLKFDLESKKAVVEKVETDSRDTKGRNYMAVYHAKNILLGLGKEQK